MCQAQSSIIYLLCKLVFERETPKKNDAKNVNKNSHFFWAYRKNGTQDSIMTQDLRKTQDPRRTQYLRRTQNSMRTQDPRRTHKARRTQGP